jgi:hypothetical protein
VSDRNPDEPQYPHASDDAARANDGSGEYTSAPQPDNEGHYTDAETIDEPSTEVINDFAEETPGYNASDAADSDAAYDNRADTDNGAGFDNDSGFDNGASFDNGAGFDNGAAVSNTVDADNDTDNDVRTDNDAPTGNNVGSGSDRLHFSDGDNTSAVRAEPSGPTATRVLPPELVQPAEPERPTTAIPASAVAAAAAIPVSTPAPAAPAAPAAPVDRSQYVITNNDDQAETARTAVIAPSSNNATVPYATRTDPADDAFARPPQRVVYVDAPTPPTKKGNRGVGALFALLSSLIFAVLFAAVIFVLYYGTIGRVVTGFLERPSFYVPVVLFAIGFVVLVLLLNRAKWGAYVFGSIFVGLFVYFGTIFTLLLFEDLIGMTPDQASAAFTGALGNPLVVIAGLLAREVSLWTGALISARGRRVKAKNIEAQAAFERETEARRAEHEASNAASARY